jgi:F-type H+-transporting ATPase subunit b
MFLLTSPLDPTQIADFLSIEIWPILAQLFATLVLIVVMSKWFYQPVKAILDKRAQFVKQHIDEALIREENAKTLEQQLKIATDQSKAQAQQLILNAQEQMDRARQQMIQDTQAQIALLKEKATQEIALAKEKALQEIEQEIVSVALVASEKILNREVKASDHQALIDAFMKDRRS